MARINRTKQPKQQGTLVPLYTGVLFVIGSLILLWAAHIGRPAGSPQSAAHALFNLSQGVETSELPDVMRVNGTGIHEGDALEHPFAVMIDNNPGVQGHYGLSDAVVVYETLAEGGYTRYLALFQNSAVGRIGPVRSARDYFVPWVLEYDAHFVHSGGSPKALDDIRKLGVRDIEEISYLGTQFFWRDKKLYSPHNLFTNAEMLDGAREYRGFDGTSETGVVFGRFSAQPSDVRRENSVSGDANVLSIDWGHVTSPEVEFVYNADTQLYERFVGGKPHVDAHTSTHFTVRTVVVLRVPQEIVLDSEGRIKLDVTGTGELTVASLGTRIDGTWEKTKTDARTRYYDSTGDEIVLYPGNIWVEVVPEDKDVIIN